MRHKAEIHAVRFGEIGYEHNRIVGEVGRILEPFSEWVEEQAHVVLKPNWIKEHDERAPGPGAWEHVITHPVVIEAVATWVGKRLESLGGGQVTVCDAPQTDSSLAKIREYCGLDEMMDRMASRFSAVKFRLLDLRMEEWVSVDGVTVAKSTLPGDPMGNTVVHLHEASEFMGYRGEGKLYGASYDMAETNQHHRGNVHDYMLCRTPMDADLFINLPKLKTHKKVGVTCALKNLVGINANKNWLPHHTEGTPAQGGDQFPEDTTKARLEQSLMGTAKRILKGNHLFSRAFVPLKKLGRAVFGDTQEVVRSGNWHGNDTCWRMVLDLNKCFFHFDGEGKRRQRPMRYLTIVDGLVAGEGNGPMAPDRKECGVLLAGTHPVAVDCVAAALMGFDWRKIPLLRNAFAMQRLSFVDFMPEDVRVVSNQPGWNGGLEEMKDTFHFRPHFGWLGAIERGGAPIST
jgi:uncharacterized protein (DUF362 family)